MQQNPALVETLFESILKMALILNGVTPQVTDLPPMLETLIREDREAHELWIKTRNRIEQAAEWEVTHLDEWRTKSTLVGFAV